MPVYNARVAEAQVPSLTDQDGSGDVSAGDVLTYDIVATNTGGVTLTNVIVSDQLSGDTATCANLLPGGTCVLAATHVVTAADVIRGQLSTSAFATSEQIGPVPLPAPATLFLPAPALSIEAAAAENADEDGSGDVSEGDTLSFEVTATNTGSANLTNVVVSDSLAPATGGTTPCALVLPQATCTFSGAYVVTAEDVDAGRIESVRTATSVQTGPVQEQGTIEVPQTPALQVTKTGTLDLGADGIANPGDAITYRFSVANTGNVTLEDVVVDDEAAGVAGCLVGTLAPGAVDSMTCSGTYVLTQADIEAGGIAGRAVASGEAPGRVVTAVSEGSGTALVIPQDPALSVERALAVNADEDRSSDVSLGDSLTFEVKATNTGNIMLTNVVVGDGLTGDETACATLAPINSCILTMAYEVTNADAGSGAIANLAYARSDQTGEVRSLTSEVQGVRIELPSNFLIDLPGWSGVSKDVEVVGTNLTLALLALITLLVATTVFNSTLEENAADVDTVVRRIAGSPGIAPAFAALGWMSADEAGGESRWLHFAKPAIIVLLTGVIYALLEPDFGLNEETLVVVAALIAGIAVATFLYEGGQVFWAARHYETPAAMRVYPLAILIAVACVALTRVTDLHPGIIFGFVTAAAIFPRGEMSRRARGEIIAVPLVALMLASLAAFLLIDPLHDFSADNTSVWATLPETIAVAVFVGGAESALLILIPVTFNDGQKIWAWNKLLWFALALPAAFAFFHVVVNEEDYGELVDETDTMTLVAICIAVLIVASATWLFFRIRRAAAID